MQKKCANSPRIITIFFLIFPLVPTIALLILKPYPEEYFNDLINNRWKINPITKIEIFDKNSSPNDLESIDYNGKKEIKYWNGKGFKITRNANLNYIKMSKKNSKICGIDSYGHELYVNQIDDCPINYIYIGTSPPNTDFEYDSISLNDGKTLYYSNKNINGTILVNINVGGIYGCGICYYTNHYCDDMVNFDLCKYKDNSSSIIDSLTINDYINDNELPCETIYEDKEISLYAERYSSLKQSFEYSNLNGLKKKNSQYTLYKYINFVILIISGIIIDILMCIDHSSKCCISVILILINIFLLIIDLGFLIQIFLTYNKFSSKIIPYISHTLREDFLTRKKWIEYVLAMLILLFIYLFFNCIIELIKFKGLNFVMFNNSKLPICLNQNSNTNHPNNPTDLQNPIDPYNSTDPQNSIDPQNTKKQDIEKFKKLIDSKVISQFYIEFDQHPIEDDKGKTIEINDKKYILKQAIKNKDNKKDYIECSIKILSHILKLKNKKDEKNN